MREQENESWDLYGRHDRYPATPRCWRSHFARGFTLDVRRWPSRGWLVAWLSPGGWFCELLWPVRAWDTQEPAIHHKLMMELLYASAF